MSMAADTRPLARPTTALAILEERGPLDLTRRLTEKRSLGEAQLTLGTAGTSLWEGAYDGLAHAARGFLVVDVLDVLKEGWQHHAELIAAAERTRGTDATEVVSLGSRDLSLVQKPSVDVVVADRTIARVAFELRIEATSVSVSGIVRGGSLVGLTSGDCTVTVTFDVAGQRLATAERTITPSREIDLGSGIPLLSEGTAGSRPDADPAAMGDL